MDLRRFIHYSDALSVKDLKDLLGIGLRQTYALIHNEKFQKLRINHTNLFGKDRVLKWLTGKSKLMESDRMELIIDDFPEYPDVLSVEMVQEILGLGKESTYQLIRNGTIHSIRVGKRFLIHKYNLTSWLNQN
jgi:excisionase family DNA binding protein